MRIDSKYGTLKLSQQLQENGTWKLYAKGYDRQEYIHSNLTRELSEERAREYREIEFNRILAAYKATL